MHFASSERVKGALALRRVVTRWRDAVGIGLLLLILPIPTTAQTQTSATFTVMNSRSGTVVYQSQSYRSTFEAVAAMYDHMRRTYPEGNLIAPWKYSGGTSQRVIHYRVPLVKPSWYGQRIPKIPVDYWEVSPHTRGKTPDQACRRYSEVYGTTQYYKGVKFRPWPSSFGIGGQGDWLCEWEGPDPYGECGGVCYANLLLQIECPRPRYDALNPDPQGEMLCGSGYVALVTSRDIGPDKPDECPVEGNPIVPSSAQKVQYETDYDGGQLLKFARSYGSQRFMPTYGDAAGAPWTHNFNAGLSIEQFNPYPSLFLGNGTVAQLQTDGLTGGIGAIAGDMLYSGRVINLNVSPVYTIKSPFEPTVEQYDAGGRLTVRSNADGRFVMLTYSDGQGGSFGGPSCRLPAAAPPTTEPPWGYASLLCVTDQFGRQLNLTTDVLGRITRLTDPAGGVIEYLYDEFTSYVPPTRGATNNLTSVKYPDGFIRTYHYNEPTHTQGVDLMSALTGISDLGANGMFTRFATFNYDGAGRAISTEHAGGVDRNQVTYGVDLSQATVTRPLGGAFTHSYTRIFGANRRTSTLQPPGAGSLACSDARTYDSRANVTSRTDFNGNTTCLAYNSRNLEVGRVEGVTGGAAACSTAFSSLPAGARLITTEWHPDWPLKTRIAEPERITTFAYNGQAATCAPAVLTLDGKPPAVVCSRTEQATTDNTGALGFGAGLSGNGRTWTYTYTTYGRVLTETDPNGKTTTTSYYPDDDPDMGRRGNVATVTNAAYHVTRITAYNLHGQPTQIVDPNGRVTDLTYDARMRLTSSKVGNQLTTFLYNPRGQVTKITLPDGSSSSLEYDAAQRLVAVRDHKGNRVDFTLDAAGNRIAERATDPNGILVKNVQRTIDALNRVQQVIGVE